MERAPSRQPQDFRCVQEVRLLAQGSVSAVALWATAGTVDYATQKLSTPVNALFEPSADAFFVLRLQLKSISSKIQGVNLVGSAIVH